MGIEQSDTNSEGNGYLPDDVADALQAASASDAGLEQYFGKPIVIDFDKSTGLQNELADFIAGPRDGLDSIQTIKPVGENNLSPANTPDVFMLGAGQGLDGETRDVLARYMGKATDAALASSDTGHPLPPSTGYLKEMIRKFERERMGEFDETRQSDNTQQGSEE